MLRITLTNESQVQVTIRVEGKIVSDWVSELECVTKRWLESGRQVVLDFSGVKSIGPQGAAMLKSLSIKNVTIVNCPALINGLLCGLDQV